MFRPFTRRIQFCFFLELVQLLACGAQGMTWLGNPDAVKRKGAGSDPSVPHNRPASEAATASPCCTALARLLSTLDASRVYDEVDDRKHGSELQSWLSWLGGALSHRAATPSLSPAELDALAAALSALACLNHVFLEPHLRFAYSASLSNQRLHLHHRSNRPHPPHLPVTTSSARLLWTGPRGGTLRGTAWPSMPSCASWTLC